MESSTNLDRTFTGPRLTEKENDMEIKPQAMAIPRETDKLEKGKYGPVYPKTPACYGFSLLAKIIPGREPVFYEYAQKIEAAVAATPNYLAPLKLHYLRWILFPIKGETYFMYQGIFDTDFDKYTEDAVALFKGAGLNTVFENLEGFPKDWKTNPDAFVRFVREHQQPSFLEYGEYPFFTADEIKKALRVKSAVSEMLDQLQ
jgi:hypothetical protein